MKALSSFRVLALAAAFGMAAVASPAAEIKTNAGTPRKFGKAARLRTAQPAKDEAASKDRKRERRTTVVTTGTLIPQKVKRVGHATDGIQSIVIFDFNEYHRSGQARLSEFLQRQPMFR